MADDDTRTEKENQRLSEFGDKTVVNVQQIFGVALSEERVESDASGFVIYQGWAVIGSSETEAVWLISKLNYDGNNFFSERVWADGENTFDKVWNDRATYNYSY